MLLTALVTYLIVSANLIDMFTNCVTQVINKNIDNI